MFGYQVRVLQWGRRFSSAEIGGIQLLNLILAASFNGAADFHRRKSEVYAKCMTLEPLASMGPPIFIGGNCTPSKFDAMEDSCFNGAADFHRRKLPAYCEGNSHVVWLQWGRRFSSAEIGGRRGDTLRARCFNGAADFHRRKSES